MTASRINHYTGLLITTLTGKLPGFQNTHFKIDLNFADSLFYHLLYCEP